MQYYKMIMNFFVISPDKTLNETLKNINYEIIKYSQIDNYEELINIWENNPYINDYIHASYEIHI